MSFLADCDLVFFFEVGQHVLQVPVVQLQLLGNLFFKARQPCLCPLPGCTASEPKPFFPAVEPSLNCLPVDVLYF